MSGFLIPGCISGDAACKPDQTSGKKSERTAGEREEGRRERARRHRGEREREREGADGEIGGGRRGRHLEGSSHTCHIPFI